MKALFALFRSSLLETARSKTALFWTLAFPLLFLFIFGFGPGRGDPSIVSYIMPGLLTITILSGSFMGLSLRLVTERETGLLRRYRVTPVTAATVVLARALTSLVALLMALAVQLGVARLVFKVTIASPLLHLAGVLVLALCAFIPLGLFVGCVARDSRSAPVLTNLTFFPLMFLSGAAFPFPMLPEIVRKLARLLPSTYVVEALQGVVVRGDALRDLSGPLLVLVATAALGVALDALLFRWESEDPIDPRRLSVALGGLVMLAAGAALLAPPLAMTRFPAGERGRPGQARSLEEMKKLDFLVGQWKGEGWIEISPGERRTFTSTETVHSKLRGLLLLIEGLHRGRLPGQAEEVTSHEALATVSWDQEAKLYRFRAHEANGRFQDAEAKLIGGALEWGFRDEQRRVSVRFTIKLNASGHWSESGESSLNGKTWRKFFEMTLERLK